MERYEFRDPAVAYERTEGKVRSAAKMLLKLKGSEREAAIRWFIPDRYHDSVRKQIKALETPGGDPCP